MAAAQQAVSFNEIIQAGRQKKKHEQLANQILGKNRRTSVFGSGTSNKTQTASPGSLASRISVTKRAASTTFKPKQNQTPSTATRPPVSSRLKAPTKRRPHEERLIAALDPASGQAAVRDNSVGITIKGTGSGPFVVVGSNFAPGTTAADIQSALEPAIGQPFSCWVKSHHPTVTAEMEFADKWAAENVIANFHHQIVSIFAADGRLLTMRLKSRGSTLGAGATSQLEQSQSSFNGLREQVDRERRQGRQAEPDFQDGRYGFPEVGGQASQRANGGGGNRANRKSQHQASEAGLYSDQMMVDAPSQTSRNRGRGRPRRALAQIARKQRSHFLCSSVRHASTFDKRKWSTPLARTLADAINVTGPIPIAAFMRQVLTNPEAGYYTTRPEDGGEVFGKKGDFVTSPEISQVFGELVGIWTVAEWIAQGRTRSGVQLVEVGPGKGTLMDDMLRTFRNFKSFASSIEAIYLVEASAALRQVQKQRLCGDAPMEETEIGHRSISKHLNVPIVWVEDIRLLPPEEEKTPFIFAHEFFDALPIHAFESVPPAPGNEVQEPQIDEITTPTGRVKLHKPLKPANTSQWRELMVTLNPQAVEENIEGEPEFRLTLAKASTPSSLVIPEISARYRALKSQAGSTIEVSPESRIYAADFARRIGGAAAATAGGSKKSTTAPVCKRTPSGAALIMDYGTLSTIPINSLRGIREHKNVPPLSAPGQVDVSADVDFTALAEAAIEASEGVEVHGPVEQGDFLQAMGIAERMQQLLKGVEEEDKRKSLESGWKRLVEKGGGGMGRIYKVLAIVPENGGKRRPVGFGGHLI
ncbi:hypothetical protein ASPZODRAFT_96917 [Penicilliopsis zonata CBS 506.65]|uniref:type II protein arginine methyltransferase n=1 Tax=Penicilliopsis zonata CBS 506.65 TaxID=1073090 RepID=A0A1L9SHD5_9EURO|nr:hypothetical protein ASPZODRAFT_96917 [Penicilliopsis zonata CBS 506.65]OJJ46605.1 hypothetical protein ASPZODRAFT_96917 [Penicilliopsis zonata CBS 506.65]